MSRRIFSTKKLILKFIRVAITVLSYLDHDLYMKLYTIYLRYCGMNIGSPHYISSSTYFDGTDYSLIEIGDNVVISSQVRLLTHDYAISRAALSMGYAFEKEIKVLGRISIGKNCFIGLRAIILPGTHIGEGSIIGAGAVVKGMIPPYSIMVGNPAKNIGDVRSWFKEKMECASDNTNTYIVK